MSCTALGKCGGECEGEDEAQQLYKMDRYLRRTFRTDRHSCLRYEYRACISLSHQGQVLTVRTVRHPYLRTIFAIYGPYVSHGRSSLIADHYLQIAVRMYIGTHIQCKYDYASLFKRTYEAIDIHKRKDSYILLLVL